MTNASSGFFSPSPTVPTLKQRYQQPRIGFYRSGFCSFEVISKRVFCSKTIQGSVSGVSPPESRVPKFVSKGCKLVGCGSAVPNVQISNDDLAKFVDTSDEWISVRTGIRNRRVLTGKENLTGLAVQAAKKALEMAQVDPDDVDLILLCTSTSDDLFGGSTQVQQALGCKNYPLAYDITAACSGFVMGLVSAACHIRGGGFKNVLVIGADAVSRFVDWTDRGSCILFGDAAGAVLVQGEGREIFRNFVKTHTPTQVASHAQEYFLRGYNRRRSSLFDITTDCFCLYCSKLLMSVMASKRINKEFKDLQNDPLVFTYGF